MKILDLALILHADHGGGNNSTFSVRVTSSTKPTLIPAVAAIIGSLKGPLHGGANVKVNWYARRYEKKYQRLERCWRNRCLLATQVLNKEAYDKTGLIYGIGHAVYTIQ